MSVDRSNKNQQVAATIIKQLGGNKFIAMTGCKDFMYGDDKVAHGCK